MPFVSPEYHQQDLRAHLERHGWDAEVVDLESIQWWLHSLWRVRSLWRPPGIVLYLGFVGDPANPESGRVHEIILGRNPPQDRFADLPSGYQLFSLSPGWDFERTKLLESMEMLRRPVS